MLFGRTTYELMEAAWPAVARDPKAAPALPGDAGACAASPQREGSAFVKIALPLGPSASFSVKGGRACRK